MLHFITLLICLAGGLDTVFGYPNGQISASCDSMLPVHGNNGPQSSVSPYNITVSNKTFSPGDVITVTIQSISGTASFKGFLLEARSVGGNWITGTFTTTDPNAQILTCSTQANSAVSHTNNNLKTTISASWTAPQGAGPVQFRATVLNNYSTFWTGVLSEIIEALQISDTTCGSQKFCLNDPTNCSPTDSTCNFMSSAPTSNGYVFEMSAPTVGYVAIGFSDDISMGNDDVYICTKNSSGYIFVQRGYTTGTVAPTITNNTAGSIVSSYTNGVLQCSFITESNISTPQQISSNPTYYVFLVSGPSNADGTILKHTKVLISSSKIDLSSFTTSGTQSGISKVVLGHGSLMLIAWMTTGSIGMIMARYMKSAAGKPFLGKAIWFQIHFFLMILTVVLTIIAFIMVFVHAGDWSGGAHPVLGCIVMILSFFQPIVAFFRPDPKNERRFIFNWGHRINALVIKILAVAAIFLGLILVDRSSNLWMPKVMGGFFAWEVLFYIILETKMHLGMRETDQENKTHIETGALLIFVCGNLAFLIALLVGIGQS
ncbi:putative ferric-chelate reductase 1 [Hyla sarda]|uniref:putative ferric-chelate reductase 1 n=1 Tax=Hyla sarda TaxID=327740 RepID=UPI0024C38CA3|nr:putative ferric-chelate reductase 1 [Hyla sarda]XP_056379296.1 putative ferric-chelate reductase 1 [Hyla sarda]XP_056379297.1 putative ferric-chelate reductase 1 [Hyla sarda]